MRTTAVDEDKLRLAEDSTRACVTEWLRRHKDE